MKINFKNIIKKFLAILELQFIISIFSWPILLYWGLPLSIMAPISNIIFLPFLSIFIIISSIIFFTEIFYIPNSYIIYILDIITNVWFKLLTYSNKSWLILCKKPNLYFIVLLLLIISLILFNKKIKSNLTKILILSVVIIIFLINFKYNKNKKIDIVILNKKLTYIIKNNNSILIDNDGALNQNLSNFFINTELIKNGISTIDNLIITKPSSTAFKNISNLINIISINNIYIPKFNSNLNITGWKNWQLLLTNIKNNNIKLFLIENKTKIDINNKEKLIIDSETQYSNKNKLKYKALKIYETLIY